MAERTPLLEEFGSIERTIGPSGQDRYYGTDPETGKKTTRISVHDLDARLAENYGFKPEAWNKYQEDWPRRMHRREVEAQNDSHVPTGSLGQMEDRAQQAIDEKSYQAFLEDRATSEEAQFYNEYARMQVWGSGNNTYSNPQTGEVIASPENPEAGILERIRHDPQFGNTIQERQAVAAEYERQLKQLMDSEGFELAQAKLVMNYRMADRGLIASRIRKLMENGLSAEEAQKQTIAAYSKADEQRRKIIKEQGIYANHQYQEFLKSKTQVHKREDEAATPIEETPAEEVPATPETEKTMEILTEDDAIDPENILILRDSVAAEWQQIHTGMSEKELANPYFVSDLIQRLHEKHLQDYLKNLDPEQVDLAKVREHIELLLRDPYLDRLQLKDKGEIREPIDEEEIEPGEEMPPPPEPGEQPKSRLRRLWNWMRDRLRHPVSGTFASIQNGIYNKGVGRDEDGKPIVPAVPPEQLPPAETEKEKKRRCLLPVLGAVALTAGLTSLAWWLSRRGGDGGAILEMVPKPKGNPNDILNNLNNIDPNSIVAHTPKEFQHGVFDLLEAQGWVPIKQPTPEQIQQLNEYMGAQGIASGMKLGPDGNLVQNIVDFPDSGHEFVNTDASAEQGFILGKDRTGREGLYDWIRKAKELGIDFRYNGPAGIGGATEVTAG